MERLLRVSVGALLLLGCGEGGSPGPEVTALTPASHEPFFPIARGVHGGLDCNACHGAFDTFLSFTCLDCHHHRQEVTDPIHASVSGYAYDSAACLACHPRGSGEAAPAEHEVWFAIGAGSVHAGQPCAGCHTTPGDRSVVTCEGSCHPAASMDSAHVTRVRVRGFEHGTAACLLCHPGDPAQRVADHRPFQIAAGDHASAACLTCHPQLRDDRPYPAADFRAFDCLNGCHQDRADLADDHEDVRGYRYESAACEACHPAGIAEDD